MNLIRKIGNTLARFMYGRNGADQLGLAMIWLLILLNIVGIFVRTGAAGTALSAVSLVLAAHLFPEPGKAPGGKRGVPQQGLVSAAPVVYRRQEPGAGQGSQVLPLFLRRCVPRAPGQGEHHHHLPAVRP